MVREGLCERALGLETALTTVLAPLSAHPLVHEVRSGAGVLAAIQLAPAAISDDPAVAGKVVAAAREAGILTRALAPGALQVSPALVIDDEGLAELVDGVGAALDAVA
jgi:putrescine---pyruvate transaminase